MKLGLRLFEKLTEENNLPATIGKGRNRKLSEERITCILYRYYYYSKIRRLKYEDVFVNLEREFYYAKRTLMNIVMSESDKLKDIFNQKPPIKTLRIKYDFLVWKDTN